MTMSTTTSARWAAAAERSPRLGQPGTPAGKFTLLQWQFAELSARTHSMLPCRSAGTVATSSAATAAQEARLLLSLYSHETVLSIIVLYE